MVEAIRNPSVTCLSHPKGRMLNHRPENALDLDRVFEVALETGIAVEVNGLPDRLDLRDENVRLALDAGVPITVSTDAHSTRGLDNMRLAVATARRGEATTAEVVNTRSLDGLLAWCRARSALSGRRAQMLEVDEESGLRGLVARWPVREEREVGARTAGRQLLLAVRHERAEGDARWSVRDRPAGPTCVGERLIQLLRRITPRGAGT